MNVSFCADVVGDDRWIDFVGFEGEQIGLAISNVRLHKSVQTLAITDELTGAFNRRYLDTRLDRLG